MGCFGTSKFLSKIVCLRNVFTRCKRYIHHDEVTVCSSTFRRRRFIIYAIAACWNVATVLRLMNNTGPTLRPSKYFFTDSVHYPGQTIRPSALQAVTKIVDWTCGFKPSTNRSDRRFFLGFRNIYRELAHSFPWIAIPMNAYLKKTIQFISS